VECRLRFVFAPWIGFAEKQRCHDTRTGDSQISQTTIIHGGQFNKRLPSLLPA
jgi:hypothetical protein